MNTISKYWEHLNKESNMLLEESGYENFKQTVGTIYNDDASTCDMYEHTKRLWGGLYDIMPAEILDKFSEPLVGGPLCIERDGHPVSIDLGVSLRDYWQIAQYIDFNEIHSIVEIGGGYGRMPYVITQLHPHIHYAMCDIEPALGLAERYLTEVVPDSCMAYISPEQLGGHTDLVIASNCLHEMSREQVHTYFNYADKYAEYIYYNCWKETTVPYDFITWTQTDYPVKNNWVKLFEQDYIRKNFFEALYKMDGTK